MNLFARISKFCIFIIVGFNGLLLLNWRLLLRDWLIVIQRLKNYNLIYNLGEQLEREKQRTDIEDRRYA